MLKPNLSNLTTTELLSLRNELDFIISSNLEILRLRETLKRLDADYFECSFKEDTDEVFVWYCEKSVIAKLDLKDDGLEHKIDALNRNKVEIGKFFDMSRRLDLNLHTIDYAFSSVFYLKDYDNDFVLRINYGVDTKPSHRFRTGEVSVKLDHSTQVSVTKFMQHAFVAKIKAGERDVYLQSDQQRNPVDLKTSYSCKLKDYFDDETVKNVMSVVNELNETYNDITFGQGLNEN